MAKYEIKDGVGIIPEGTDYIVSCAFEDCKELTSVVIPNSVTSISWNAFNGCTGLKSVQEVILRKDPPVVNEVVDCKVRKVILPKSVTSFKAPAALKKLVEKK